MLKKHNVDLGKLMELHGTDSSGRRELKLDELTDMIPVSKNLFKGQGLRMITKKY